MRTEGRHRPRMIQTLSPVTSVQSVASNILIISLRAPEIASTVRPGQFINIRVSDCTTPLLRRPFSVYRTRGDELEIIFNVVGVGTRILAEKQPGDRLDVLGPLGRSYTIDDSFQTALLVAGGIGVAPLPMITTALRDTRASVVTFLGARTRDQLMPTHLVNLSVSTDDGTAGFRGTVVELLRSELSRRHLPAPKIFACGPNAMLQNLIAVANEFNVPCEASLESAMACGVGICQGCPVELLDGEKKFALVCADGPVFDTRTIRIEEW